MLPNDSYQAATLRGIYRNFLIAFLLLLPWIPGYSATRPNSFEPGSRKSQSGYRHDYCLECIGNG